MPEQDLKHGATQDCTYLNLGGGMRLLNNSKDIFRKNFENGTAQQVAMTTADRTGHI